MTNLKETNEARAEDAATASQYDNNNHAYFVDFDGFTFFNDSRVGIKIEIENHLDKRDAAMVKEATAEHLKNSVALALRVAEGQEALARLERKLANTKIARQHAEEVAEEMLAAADSLNDAHNGNAPHSEALYTRYDEVAEAVRVL